MSFLLQYSYLENFKHVFIVLIMHIGSSKRKKCIIKTEKIRTKSKIKTTNTKVLSCAISSLANVSVPEHQCCLILPLPSTVYEMNSHQYYSLNLRKDLFFKVFVEIYPILKIYILLSEVEIRDII